MVQAGAVINASSSQGDAGEVIIWADGSTEFAGTLNASSDAGAGGFAEVSGKQTLNIAGISVDLAGVTSGGELLLDPTDITITAGATVGVNQISDAFIEANLNAGTNVTVSTTSPDPDVGDIDIEAGVRINFTNSGIDNDNPTLTLTATNDINALDDIIIQNFGSGADIDQNEGGIVLNAGNDINIGSADNRTGGVAIGSEFGVTVLNAGVDAADAGTTAALDPTITAGTGNINIIGGNTDDAAADADGAFAHVGFILDEARNSSVENGDITVRAGADITVTGGGQGNDEFSGLFNFAQIGHGGATQDLATNTRHSVFNSDITVDAEGDLNITCLLYTSPSPRDLSTSRMPSSA